MPAVQLCRLDRISNDHPSHSSDSSHSFSRDCLDRPLRRGALWVGLLLGIAICGCDGLGETAQNRFVGTQVTAEQFAGTEFFEQISASDKLVIVDFTATWCGPCQQLKPLLQELETAGRCELLMIDTDEYPAVAEQFRVNGIPHLLFIQDGQIRDVHRGSASRGELDQILQGL